AAVGLAERGAPTDAAAVGTDRLVADEGAADDDGGRPGALEAVVVRVIRIPDGTSLDVGGADLADGPGGHERTVDEREDAAQAVADGAPVIERLVVGEDVVGEVQGAAAIQDGAAPAAAGILPLDVPVAQAVRDGQSVDGDGDPTADVEDAVGVVAADGQKG